MRKCSPALATMILSTGLGLFVLAQEGAEPAIPAPILAKMVAEDAKFLQGALAKKGNLKDKAARKIKGAALLLAAYAQDNMNKENAAELATLRDAALKLIKAVDAGKLAEAKGLADALAGKIKIDPAAKPGRVSLQSFLILEFVMRTFSSKQVGGFGMEIDLEELVAAKGPLDKGAQEKAVHLAYKIATIGHLTQSYTPDKGDPKKWSAYARQMHASALALAESAKANKNVGPAAEKLTATCAKCHDEFR